MGGGAKGVAFLNQFDCDGQNVEAVIDINPAKQGKYIVGTGHPIVSPDYLYGVKSCGTIIVMNKNYVGEIRSSLSAMGISGWEVLTM